MTVPLAEQLGPHIAAQQTLEDRVLEDLAHELEIPLEELERRLYGGGDAEQNQRDTYRHMVKARIQFIQDDGD